MTAQGKRILLIHPPLAKPGEPPAGPAKLAGWLTGRGIGCRVYDANLDGLLGLLTRPAAAGDTWTRRAAAQRSAHLAALRSLPLYAHRDRYRRAVQDLNRLLRVAGEPHGVRLSLTHFTAPNRSPARSKDLLQAAEQPTGNPFYPFFSEALTDLCRRWEPDLFGVSLTFTSQALCAFAIIGFLRARFAGKPIVCGGGLVTSWLRIPSLGNPFAGWVDELIEGPGETRLAALCQGTPAPRGSRCPPVVGYAYDDTALDDYLAPLRVLPYAASRGCFWKKCAFCPETAEQRPYRSERPARVGADLAKSLAACDAGLVHFLDNALSPRLLRHLIERPPGVPWYGFARFSPHLADRDFAAGLRRCGCVMLKLGVESGDQAVLDALGKGIRLDLVARALAALHDAGIATYVYLLFGTPAENEQSALRTLAFTAANAAHIDFLNLALFNLPAHGQQAATLQTTDFYAGDLSLYRDFVHPLGWGRDRVRRFLSGTFKRQAAIQRILAHDPPFFGANHAPFFRLARAV